VLFNTDNKLMNSNLKRDALYYALSNILSISLLLDIGVKYELDSDMINNAIKILGGDIDNDEKKSFVDVLDPNLLVYSKIGISSDRSGARNIIVEDSSKDETINIKNQALLIINEILLGEFLFNNSVFYNSKESNIEEKLLSIILIHSSLTRLSYIIDKLMNEEGYFVSHEGSSFFDYEDQGYVLLALQRLYEMLYEKNFKIYFPKIKEQSVYKNAIEKLIYNLKLDEENILSLETIRLCDLVSSISQVNSDRENSSLKYLITSIGDELVSREFYNGYISKYRLDNKPASLETHFRAIDALMNAYNYTELLIFYDTAKFIYENLNALWDKDLQLYRLKNSNKVKYTSKNISYIISALYKLIASSNDIEEYNPLVAQLEGFFRVSLKDTGLQIQPNILSRLPIERTSDNTITKFLEDLQCCIILKGFKKYLSKDKVVLDKKFNIENALLFTNSMLNLLK